MSVPVIARPGLRSWRLFASNDRPSNIICRRCITSTPSRNTPSTSKALVSFNKTPARPDLLFRVANRPLPTLKELSPNRRWIRTFPIFVLICVASAMGIFNYQKVNSPIVSATLYSLRTNPRVREELGDQVYFASNYAWIWGPINLVQGKVDIHFKVKGSRAQGMCRFRARRHGGRDGMFQTEEWSLTMDDGKCIQLLEKEAQSVVEAGEGPLGSRLF